MNRRREQRFDLDQTVTLTELERAAPSTTGRLANVSATGVNVLAARGYRSGTALRIECGETQLFGTVVRCSPAGQEFSLGIELEDAVYPGSCRRRVRSARVPRRKPRSPVGGTR